MHELSHACSVRLTLGLPRPAWGFGPGAWALTEVWSLLNDLIPVLLDNMALSSIGTRKSDLHKAMLWQRSIHKRTTWALH